MASILVVDDDGPAAKLYVSLLRICGHDAAYVTNGPDALDRLGSATPDLVILDLMMPEMNGLEVLQEIKSREQMTSLPVVIFSAVEDGDWRDRAASAGANDYWVKGGFDFGQMQEKIAACLENHRSQLRRAGSLGRAADVRPN